MKGQIELAIDRYDKSNTHATIHWSMHHHSSNIQSNIHSYSATERCMCIFHNLLPGLHDGFYQWISNCLPFGSSRVQPPPPIPNVCGVRVTRSLVLYVICNMCRTLFVLLLFLLLCRFFDLQILITQILITSLVS